MKTNPYAITQIVRYACCLLITHLSIHIPVAAQAITYGYHESAGQYFRVDDQTQLYFEQYGEGSPVLLLHGGVFGYIGEFSELIDALRLDHQVICLATRGHVKSDIGVAPYTYEQRAEDAFKLLEHLNLDQVTVIGFSDGGYAAYKLAALYPDRVRKMVVMGAGDDPVMVSDPPFTYTVDKLMGSFPEFFEKRLKHMPQPERWSESLDMLNDLYNNSMVSKETFSQIQCPVLIMAGDNDQFSGPEQCLQAHRYIDQSQLSIIPGCGHVILHCNFPAVWASLEKFLND